MIKLTTILVLSLTIVSCCGCRVSNSKQKKMLTTTQWVVEGQNTEEESFTLSFDPAKGEIFGVGACNRYFGTYKTEGKNGIDLDPHGMTRMACNDNGEEQRFVDMLDSVDEFYFDGDKLLLFDNENLVATFVASVAK